jgi:hypothetical protein
MKTGARKSRPHYRLMQLSVELLRFFQMEWQILIAMGNMSVTSSKSVSLYFSLPPLNFFFLSLKFSVWFEKIEEWLFSPQSSVSSTRGFCEIFVS